MDREDTEINWAEVTRHYRQSKGLLQKQMAHELGVDVMTVSRWERGLTVPSLSKQKVLLDHVRDDRSSPVVSATDHAARLQWPDLIKKVVASSGISLSHLASLVDRPIATVRLWVSGAIEPDRMSRAILRDLIVHKKDPASHPVFDFLTAGASVAVYSLTTGKFLFSRDENRLLGNQGRNLEGKPAKEQSSSFAHTNLEAAGGFRELRRSGVVGYEIAQRMNGDDFLTVSSATIVRLLGYEPIVVITREKDHSCEQNRFRMLTEADLPG